MSLIDNFRLVNFPCVELQMVEPCNSIEYFHDNNLKPKKKLFLFNPQMCSLFNKFQTLSKSQTKTLRKRIAVFKIESQ